LWLTCGSYRKWKRLLIDNKWRWLSCDWPLEKTELLDRMDEDLSESLKDHLAAVNKDRATPKLFTALLFERSFPLQWQTTGGRCVTIGGFFPKETSDEIENGFKDLVVWSAI